MLKILLVSINVILALFIFQHGFLLKRQEIQEKSSCNDAKGDGDSCWMKPQYNRIVLILIDALRYDFLWPEEYCANNEDLKYSCGKMKFVNELLKNESIMLGTLIADPPTTTVQRLKAITTGTLPTFIDAGENFSPDSQVEEDNFLYQAKQLGKNVTLLGDNTWLSLYPKMFTRFSAYDSFDINDLNTVDDKIKPMLQDEIENSTSSLIIAHFLGVDHCGHKFGPKHIVMAEILKRMDKVIENTVNALREDDLLMVFGDHGMTPTGDHGGETVMEISAGYFAYSKRGFVKIPRDPIYQIDLVPTVALLLGLPIPFSNLGTVISTIFPAHLKETAIALNYEQIKRFGEVYARQNSFAELHSHLAREENTPREQMDAMFRIQTSLRVAWTQFDNSYINVGILILIEAFFFILSEQPLSHTLGIFRSGCVLLQIAVLWDNEHSSKYAVTLLMMTLSVSCLSSMFKCLKNVCNSEYEEKITPSYLSKWAMAIHSLSQVSNSFIVYEATVTRFLIQSLMLWSFFSNFEKKRRNMKVLVMAQSLLTDRNFHLLITSLLILRFEPFFHRCREEQVNCIQFDAPLVSSQLTRDTQYMRLIVSTGMIFAFNYLVFDKVFKKEKSLIRTLSYPVLFLVFLHVVFKVFTNFGVRANLCAFFTLLFSILMSLGANESYLYFLVFPLYVLVGDGLQPAIIGLVWVFYSCCKLVPSDALPSVISLLVTYGFYYTGHSPVISSIPWNAAFIGIPGRLNLRLLPAALVLTHINVASVISAVVVFANQSKISGETCLLLQLLRSIVTCVSSSIHRRHLMVWKVFAPKFIFESVSFIVYLVVYNFLQFFRILGE